MVPMLQRTPENYKVSIFRLIDSDPEKINFNHVIKAFYMVSSDTYEDKWQSRTYGNFSRT